MPKQGIIIGSGIGGMAAGIRLAAQGYDVSVLEASDRVGGKLAELRTHGFRFDKGPSLFTMPGYLLELFALHGKKWEDYFAYRKLDIVTKYFYEDGTQLTAYADPHQFQEELCEKMGERKESVASFFRNSHTLYKITEPVFLQKSLHKLSTYLNASTLRSMAQLYKIDALRTMHQANKSYFKNPKTVQLFDRYATYNGSNPYEAPATLNVIAHLEHEIGAFFPTNGMYSIVESLTKLSNDIGVKLFCGEAAQEIYSSAKQVNGVRTSKTLHPANLVVSNADIAHTYQRLLPQERKPMRLLQQPKSSSALIFYWGMKASFPELQLHNIFFSADYRNEFEAMFKQGTIFDDPTVYVFISSKEVPADAPQGQENWFVMVNAPHHAGQNWEELIEKTRQSILSKLSRMLGKPIAEHIVCEELLDPPGIERHTSSQAGALYGNSSNSKWAAFMRHPNFFSSINNLYCTGGSVHPGGGIPLCLLSAKIVGELVAKEG